MKRAVLVSEIKKKKKLKKREKSAYQIIKNNIRILDAVGQLAYICCVRLVFGNFKIVVLC